MVKSSSCCRACRARLQMGPLVDRCDPSRSSRPSGVPLSAQSATTTITRAVTVAAGAFAPGHLGELTQYLPFELAEGVLEQTRAVQHRLRDLPSRAGVYFVLALGMFPRLGYARVWEKLIAGLAGVAPHPPEKARRDVRRRLGPVPLKALFEVVAAPGLTPPGRVFNAIPVAGRSAGIRPVARALRGRRRAAWPIRTAGKSTEHHPRSGRSAFQSRSTVSTLDRCPTCGPSSRGPAAMTTMPG